MPAIGSKAMKPLAVGCAAPAASATTTGTTSARASGRRERSGPQQHRLELRPEALIELLAVVHEPHRRPAVGIANQVGKHVVNQRVILEVDRRAVLVRAEEILDGL